MIAFILGLISGLLLMSIFLVRKNKRTIRLEKECEKFKLFYSVLVKWLGLRRLKKGVGVYLEEKHFETIAIYGMKELGTELLKELEKSNIKVKYAIDRDAANIYEAVDIYTPNEELPSVDAIIVTAVYYYDEIKKEISSKVNCPIISLTELLKSYEE